MELGAVPFVQTEIPICLLLVMQIGSGSSGSEAMVFHSVSTLQSLTGDDRDLLYVG